MKRIFVISSFVAGSNVGGGLAMKVAPQLGLDVSLLPTTMLGRHPGWGAPGGGAVPFDLFKGMAEGLLANSIPQTSDAVITGYFANRDQVMFATDLIREHLKGRVPVIVDPIMGDDEKGLYVKDDVADAIVSELVPLADILTPNAWEFEEILLRRAGIVSSDEEVEALAEPDAELKADIYITSFRYQGEIGILGPGNQFAGRAELEQVPNGIGDLASLLIASHVIAGQAVNLDEVIAKLSKQIEMSSVGDLTSVVA